MAKKGRPKKDKKDDLMIDAAPQDAGNTDVINSSEEKMEITKSELEEIIEIKMEKLKEENKLLKDNRNKLHKEVGLGEWREDDVKKPRKKFGYLKLYRLNSDEPYGLVISWKQHKTEKDNSGHIKDQIYKITCLYEDDTTKELKVPLLELSTNADRERVEIIEEDRKKISRSMGKVRKSTVDKAGYTRSMMGNCGLDIDNTESDRGYVDLMEYKDKVELTIKRANGQTLKMPEKYLNT